MPGRLARRASLTVTASLLTAGALFASGPAGAASIPQLQQRISAGQSRISSLSGTLSTTSNHLSQLNSGIAALQQRISGIEAERTPAPGRAVPASTPADGRAQPPPQVGGVRAHAESVLSSQLINTYEAGRPDLVSVVLQATGFQDLLERLSFASRIEKQDVQVVTQVRSARRAVAAEAVHLGSLEVKQRTITEQIVKERNSVVASQEALLRQRLVVARTRSHQAGQLSSARSQVASLQHQLSQVQAAQAAAAARAAAAAAPASSASASPSTGTAAPPPSAPSSGGFVFPLPKSAASPPSTWSPDQGVDISAPGDTPEYAVCSGTIVLHGIGGFGPWAPVLHCDSSLDGYDYVYYGHAGPMYQLPVGTHVGAGQVMSSIGPGIVGISTGPHLEIGFADSSGSPVGAQTRRHDAFAPPGRLRGLAARRRHRAG